MFQDLDSDRISALFASFPQEKTIWNEASYNEKLDFWLTTVEAFVESSNSLTLNSINFPFHFKYKNAFPLCLETVFLELIQSGKLVKESEFATSFSVFKVFGKVINFALGAIGEKPLFETDCLYVYTPFMTEITQKIKCQHKDLMEVEDFEELLCEIQVKKQDFHLVKRYLQYQNIIQIKELDKLTILKFTDGENPISDNDVAMIKLNQTVKKLKSQVDEIESKIEK